MPDYYYGFLIILLLVIILALIVALRRVSKINHLPPEHRAKENELYEAFGLDVHREEIPKDHKAKEKEVEEAFEKMPKAPKKKNRQAKKKSKK